MLLLPQVAFAKSDNFRTRNGDIRDAGDYLQFLIPAAGLAGTFIADDREGRLMWSKAGLTAVTWTHSMKQVYGRLRPDAGKRNSFPSGHTTGAFYGAEFIRARYGNLWGIPAYAGAALTGYSRWWADAHFLDDVLTGASIGIMSNWMFVSPYSDDIAITPMVVDGGYGINLMVKTGADGNKKKPSRWHRENFDPTYHFSINFGPSWIQKNVIKAPELGGTSIDLANFNKRDDPTTVGNPRLWINVEDRHSVELSIAPFESRDVTTTTEDIIFKESLIPAGTEIESSFRLYDFRGTYYYKFNAAPRWDLRLGAGLSYQYTNLEFRAGGTAGSGFEMDDVELHSFIPYLSGVAAYDITRKWEVNAVLSGTAIAEDSLLEIMTGVTYHINPQWDISTGFWLFNREIEDEGVANDTRYDGWFLSVGHTF